MGKENGQRPDKFGLLDFQSRNPLVIRLMPVKEVSVPAIIRAHFIDKKGKVSGEIRFFVLAYLPSWFPKSVSYCIKKGEMPYRDPGGIIFTLVGSNEKTGKSLLGKKVGEIITLPLLINNGKKLPPNKVEIASIYCAGLAHLLSALREDVEKWAKGETDHL